jgi:ABC-type glycerol-3-phosphate transport system substrate-binding protein
MSPRLTSLSSLIVVVGLSMMIAACGQDASTDSDTSIDTTKTYNWKMVTT